MFRVSGTSKSNRFTFIYKILSSAREKRGNMREMSPLSVFYVYMFELEF